MGYDTDNDIDFYDMDNDNNFSDSCDEEDAHDNFTQSGIFYSKSCAGYDTDNDIKFSDHPDEEDAHDNFTQSDIDLQSLAENHALVVATGLNLKSTHSNKKKGINLKKNSDKEEDHEEEIQDGDCHSHSEREYVSESSDEVYGRDQGQIIIDLLSNPNPIHDQR